MKGSRQGRSSSQRTRRNLSVSGRLPSGGEQSLVTRRGISDAHFYVRYFTPFGISTTVCHLLGLWQRRHLTGGTTDLEEEKIFTVVRLVQCRLSLLSMISGNTGTSREVQVSSRLRSSSRYVLLQQSTSSFDSFQVSLDLGDSRIVRKSPTLGRPEETGWRSCQLGSATVAHTRQPEETGPGSCQIHQTGEEFLNSEDALEETEMPSTGQAGGTDVVRRRASSGKLLQVRSRTPLSTKALLATRLV